MAANIEIYVYMSGSYQIHQCSRATEQDVPTLKDRLQSEGFEKVSSTVGGLPEITISINTTWGGFADPNQPPQQPKRDPERYYLPDAELDRVVKVLQKMGYSKV